MNALPKSASRMWLDGNGAELTSEPAGSGRCVLIVRKSPSRDEGAPCEDVAGVVSWDDRTSALIVADGLGGHGDGDVASRLTLRAIVERLEAVTPDVISIQAGILAGIEAANQALLDRPGGAATTILVALIEDDRFRSYHAGDSELLITGQRGKIKHQTVSHSPIGYAVESGLLDAEQGFVHEDRHIISNCVGMAGMRVEIASAIKLARRDTVVLASDGLWDNLHVTEVTEIVRKGDLLQAGRRLAELCAARMAGVAEGWQGKPDDLTILLYRSR
ncbi:MAG: protein phosphatase 2C domain-containing protein [Planctomycetes bacterium]|nr:protein phosphatase 2C domain-containing protein [Planctomycetota bacterium]